MAWEIDLQMLADRGNNQVGDIISVKKQPGFIEAHLETYDRTQHGGRLNPAFPFVLTELFDISADDGHPIIGNCFLGIVNLLDAWEDNFSIEISRW